MYFSDPFSLGILLIALGLVFFGLANLLIKLVPKIRPTGTLRTGAKISDLVDAHEDATLIVEDGGRLVSLNFKARELFGIPELEYPDLERLIKVTRPGEKFLFLCATESGSHFTVNGQRVTGKSYSLADSDPARMLVALHKSGEKTIEQTGQYHLANQSIETFFELSQLVVSSLELEDVLQAIFNYLEKILPTDFVSISLWDATSEILIPYRFIGLPGLERRLVKSNEHYHLGEGYVGSIANERKVLFFPNLQANQQQQIADQRGKLFLPRSYIGVPMLVGQELIGTLEVGNLTPDAFQKHDVDLVNVIAQQAAVSIHNSILYREEKKRAAELSGLAQLYQSVGFSRDKRSLYEKLLQSIQPLIDVNILGFLIFNENQRVLEGQVPFLGLPEQFVGLYRVPILANSAAEQTLLEQDVLITENAAEDAQWDVLGLDHLAQAASLRDTVLMPLSSNGHFLGYLQASNHSSGSQMFTRDELHLLMIVANQAAPIIANATLVAQTRQRAQRAEALRKVASLSSSAANLEEILKFSLQELAHLMRADVAAAFLIDRENISLRLHPSSVFGKPPIIDTGRFSIGLDDVQFPFTCTGNQHSRVSNNFIEEQAVIPFYQYIRDNWKIGSVEIVPLIVRDSAVGEIWVGSKATDSFDQGDLQVLFTAAGQLAGVVERSFLMTHTDDSLRRRVEELTTLTRINRELSSSLDFGSLLQVVYDEALRITNADCGSIVLFDLTQPEDVPPVFRFQIGDSIDRGLVENYLRSLESGDTLYIPDVEFSEETPPHEDIKSFLIIPALFKSRQAGLVMLHSTHVNAFDSSSIEVASALASQAAIALNNALQFENETKRNRLLSRELETLSELVRVLHILHPDHPLEDALAVIANALQKATPFQTVLISIYDDDTKMLNRVYSVGIPEDLWIELKAHTQSWDTIERVTEPQYKVGLSYFIPAESQPNSIQDLHSVVISPTPESAHSGQWDQDDLLLIPLYSSNGSPMALISLDSPADGRRPDEPTFEALELFSLQAALLIEYRRQIALFESQLAVDTLVAPQVQTASFPDIRNTQGINQVEGRYAIEISRMERQIDRMRHGIDIVEITARQNSVTDVLHTLAEEFLFRFEMKLVLIGEKSSLGMRYLDSIGDLPPRFVPEALFGQRNPLRQLLQEEEIMIVADVNDSPVWKKNPMMNSFGFQSVIGIPFNLETGHVAGILALGDHPLSMAEIEQDRYIFSQLSRQISVLLQNLKLFETAKQRLHELDLLLKFSQKLGTLDPTGILQTLVETSLDVISTADAVWVGIWNENEQCLIPEAAAGYADNKSILKIRVKEKISDRKTGKQTPLVVLQEGAARRIAELNFTENYNLSSDDWMHFRKAAEGRLPVSSMFIPIRRDGGSLGVLVLDNFEYSDAFKEEDELLALSLVQQTALALENARLFKASESRAAQLLSMAEVAMTVSLNLQTDALIGSLLDQLKAVIPYDTATLWLRDGNTLTVAETSGFSDLESRKGLKASVEDSLLFQEMMQTCKVILVPDVRQDSRFPGLLEPELLAWMGIPLIAKSEVVGLLALEKREPFFYTEDHVQMAANFAGQSAVALENARLFEESERRSAELDQRSKRLAMLNRYSGELGTMLDVDRILELVVGQISQAVNLTRVSAVLITGKGQVTLQREYPSDEILLPQPLELTPWLNRLAEGMGIFIADDVLSDYEIGTKDREFFISRKIRSLLVVPLVSGLVLQGWLWIQKAEVYRFNSSEIEIARTMANQAAIAIQNARLFAETRSLTEDLEKRVADRTVELSREHHNTETLLRVIVELSASLDMDQVINRTLTVLKDALGAQQAIIVMAQKTERGYGVGENLMDIPSDQPAGITVDREIAHWVMRHHSSTIINDYFSDPRWEDLNNTGVNFNSALAVPLLMGEDILGALLLLHRECDVFNVEQISLVETAARQIGITLKNAELFNLIRDQSEHLGVMLRDQQIEANRSRAILEAVADGVIVTDHRSRITLFNASAERILGIQAQQVIKQPLNSIVSLFGEQAGSWIHTISVWSDSSDSYLKMDTYAEQIDLENDRVISIHLSPVIWRSEFMGTVSIFRDITYETQVDRMKSEFVTNVSHELRTPLTSIKGYVDVMLMGAAGELNDQQTRFIQIVRTNAERLNMLVNDLLEVSRIDTGRISLSIQPFDLRALAEDAAANILRRSREENKPLNIRMDIPDDLPKIHGDPDRIRQVIGNLMMNGYNYTPSDGHLQIRAHNLGAEVQVDILDDGIGIPLKDQSRIFERFYRGNDPLVLATSGNGLGLAMAKTLVEMHRGRIWFESTGEPGEGSVFSFTIPVAESKE